MQGYQDNVVDFPGGGGGAPPTPDQGGAAPPPGGAPGGGPGRPLFTPPGMTINPAFVQWSMMSQMWHAEQQRRQQQFMAACQLIRHDSCDGYKIDIEADSTVAADEEAEKAARTEFLTAMLPMLQLLIPQAQTNPGSVPLIHALVMFGVRAFPSARSLEQEFEEAFRTLLTTPPQPPPPKGNVKPPEELASEERIAAGDRAVDTQENQVKAAQVQVQQQKNAIDLFKAYMSMSSQNRAQQQEAAFRTAELASQSEQEQQRAQLDRARLTHLISRDATGLV